MHPFECESATWSKWSFLGAQCFRNIRRRPYSKKAMVFDVTQTSGLALSVVLVLAATTLGCAADHQGEPQTAVDQTQAGQAPVDVGADASPVDASATSTLPVPVPPGARISIEPLKRRFLLGENLLVHFTVKNVGEAPFTISHGGDYRGASRHLRFKVIATDASGRQQADPVPTGYCLGGLSGNQELAPGEAFHQTLQLTRYARFEKAGTYRIRIAHDLGWSPGGEDNDITDDDPRWAETVIELVMPNAKQAEQVVQAMAALPLDPNRMAGEKTIAFADFSCLSSPVYLPILEKRALAGEGSVAEIAGIGGIPTPEATTTLIRLVKSCSPECATAARGALFYRLPDPQLAGKLPPRNVFHNDHIPQRQEMTRRAWRPEHAAAVREMVPALLASDDIQQVRAGAFVLEALGDRTDVPALTKALDRAIAATLDLPLETHVYPRPRGSCQELLRATSMLIDRGATASSAPSSPGEIVFYVLTHNRSGVTRPPDYGQRAAGWLDHDIPYIHELVLLRTTPPYPAELLDRLPTALASTDVEARIAACRVAGRSREARFRDDILTVLRSARDRNLINVATNVAHDLEIPRDQRARVYVERLGDPEVAFHFWRPLRGMFMARSPGSGGSTTLDLAAAQTLQAAWRRFLRDHGKQLAPDRRFDVPSPEITADLFPPGYRLRLEDGTEFPPRPE